MSALRTRSVSSPRNPLVQRFRAAAAGDEPDVLLAEGVRLCGEGLAAGLAVVAAAVSPRLRDEQLAERLRAEAAEMFECSDAVLARASALDTHQGVAALFARPRWRDEDLLRGGPAPLVVAAAGVRDPGNLGALLRAAEAAGASGVATLQGGADPWREKAVRGSMGSVFRLPIRHGMAAADVVAFAQQRGLQLVVAAGDGDRDYTACDLRGPTLLVLGAEAQGVPEPLLAAAAVRARIPLQAPVESLNVAVAAGVLLFEARRQRR